MDVALPPLTLHHFSISASLSIEFYTVSEPKLIDTHLPQRNNKSDLWAYLWGVSFVLANCLSTTIAAHPELLGGSSHIMEVGAGSALCSVVAKKLTNATMVVSDFAAEALALAKKNMGLCHFSDSYCRMKTKE
jgi:predicted nicotinamide N-methyase